MRAASVVMSVVMGCDVMSNWKADVVEWAGDVMVTSRGDAAVTSRLVGVGGKPPRGRLVPMSSRSEKSRNILTN